MTHLSHVAAAIKLRFLAMYKKANAGHVGCSLSCAEMLAMVRFGWMKDGDRLVLSKGHAAAALYATLAEAGTLTDADLATFYQDGTKLAAHPPPALAHEAPFATGSLGHGLSIAAGLALGSRLADKQETVYCITSDGELNEGGIWEAAMFARQHRLNNLVWLIDRNRLQGFGSTEEVMALEPLADKIRSFGFAAGVANGHDFGEMEQARTEAAAANAGLPVAVICNTIKGKGLGKLENTVASHYLPMDDQTYEAIVRSLRAELEVRHAG